VAGSSIAMIALNDARLAEDFARAGLASNCNDDVLLNNLTVSLAVQGRVQDAHDAFRKIRNRHDDESPQFVNAATAGLLAFRSGDFDLGRQLYSAATGFAPGIHDKTLVRLHWIQEEIESGTKLAAQIAQHLPSDKECEKMDPLVYTMYKRVVQRLAELPAV
jgi:hypothetical protein